MAVRLDSCGGLCSFPIVKELLAEPFPIKVGLEHVNWSSRNCFFRELVPHIDDSLAEEVASMSTHGTLHKELQRMSSSTRMQGLCKETRKGIFREDFLVKIMSPLSRWYVSVGSFKWCSLSLYGNWFMLVTILVARHWTSSSNFLSFLKKGAANDIPTSRCGCTSALYNFIRTLGCQLEMVLFMILRVLFAEDETDLAWLLNFNWWSTITPRSLSLETAERKLSWRKYLWCLLFLPKWITWHFSTLKVRSHMLAYLSRLSRSVWIDCWSEGVAAFPTSFESSA